MSAVVSKVVSSFALESIRAELCRAAPKALGGRQEATSALLNGRMAEAGGTLGSPPAGPSLKDKALQR